MNSIKNSVALVLVIAGLFLAGKGIGKALEAPVNAPSVEAIQLEEVAKHKETFESEAPTFREETIKVHNIDIHKGTVLYLFEEVNSGSADVVINGINASNRDNPGKPIYLLLDSPGGSVLDGARIISTMQSSKSPVYTICVSICASMAAIITEYGKERYMVDRATLMFHPASVGGMVNEELDKVVSRYTYLQRYVDKMDRRIAKRAGISYEEFKAKTTQELWIDAEDAVDQKLADKIVAIQYVNPNASIFGGSSKTDHLFKLK